MNSTVAKWNICCVRRYTIRTYARETEHKYLYMFSSEYRFRYLNQREPCVSHELKEMILCALRMIRRRKKFAIFFTSCALSFALTAVCCAVLLRRRLFILSLYALFSLAFYVYNIHISNTYDTCDSILSNFANIHAMF